MVYADLVDAEGVRRALLEAIERAGGQSALAREIGCTRSLINQMKDGKGPWAKIYEALGFELVPMFRRVRG